MKKLIILVAGIAMLSGTSWAQEIAFGPEQYCRTGNATNVWSTTFTAEAGLPATIEVNSGEGASTVTSASITLNGEALFGPSDFNPRVDTLEESVTLQQENLLQVELGGAPGSCLDVQVTLGFFEKYPAWRMPDLGITDLAIAPPRAAPGDNVTLRATVSAVNTGPTDAAELRFLVDGAEVSRTTVPALEPAASVDLEAVWQATPGRHEVLAELVLGAETMDYSNDNNRRSGIVRISGDTILQAELELRPTFEMAPLPAVPGEPYTFVVEAFNPSFVSLTGVEVDFLIDGNLLGTEAIETLAPGEVQTLSFTWDEAEVGRHILNVIPVADLDPVQIPVLSVDAIVMYQPKQLYSYPQKSKWVSMGPRVLAGSAGAGLPPGSVGRVVSIAFDPRDPQWMYAGAAAGGLWQSWNGGLDWHPLTDGLPTLHSGSVAVDPENSDILYYGTGYFWGELGIGIFKSVDRGVHWSHFASKVDMPFSPETQYKVVRQLVVRRPEPGKVLIYAATDRGVLRYESSDPSDLRSDTSEWQVIKRGRVWDLAVNPNDDSELFASTEDGGIFRTTQGRTVQGDADWQSLFPVPGGKGFFKIDVFWDKPRTVWAAIGNPGGAWSGQKYVIFRSLNNGLNWTVPYGIDRQIYNAFLRVHPTDPNEIYFGGVDLFWCQGNCGDGWKISGVHADQKAFEWHPNNPNVFYVTNDGGVFRCEWNAGRGHYDCLGRNFNMRVTMFYDIDASFTNPDLMIGGTQDNGTIMFEGNPDSWRVIKGGDGNYSLITLGDQFFFAQHQHLDDTKACGKGTGCRPGDWGYVAKGLPSGDKWNHRLAQIEKDPLFSEILYSVGDQVYLTGTWGINGWTGIGPLASDGLQGCPPENKNITRVAIHPTLRQVFAGTCTGRIFVRAGTWQKIFEPWAIQGKVSVRDLAFSPANPDVLFVVFSDGDQALRIMQLQYDPTTIGATATPMGGNFPSKSRIAMVIAGDAYDENVAYVGTDKGVFRGKAACTGCLWFWNDYSDGLPLVKIEDILVDPSSKELRAGSWGRGAWSVITGP